MLACMLGVYTYYMQCQPKMEFNDASKIILKIIEEFYACSMFYIFMWMSNQC